MQKLSDYLETQSHIRKLQSSFNKADTKEIDLLKTIQETKQEMELIDTVREFETQIEDIKKMGLDFEQEKKQNFKDLEKAITNGLNNAFKK